MTDKTVLNNGIEEETIHVVLDESAGENCGYKYNVKFLSLEGYDCCWKKEQADQIRQQILNNQAIVEELKNLRDFHSGKGTVPRFSHADILNELVILLKTTHHSGSKTK